MTHVLVLNSGSTSVKAALYTLDDAHRANAVPRWRGTAVRTPGLDAAALLERVLQDLPCGTADITVVGHRVVHGGAELRGPVVVDGDVRRHIEAAAAYAPLHNPPALALLDAAAGRLTGAAMVAVFDTAFHGTIPPAAAAYGGPFAWWERGWRRYGFHGISHRDATERAAALIGSIPEELCAVSVHLGGGCSATAVRHGRSVDTTMGLSPTDGLVMATRAGAVDPQLILLALQDAGGDLEALRRLLDAGAGVLGLSGTTADISQARDLGAAGDERAALAYGCYVHRVRTAVGAMAIAAGGCDVLVLTGGALEHDPLLRADIVAGLVPLGLHLDPAVNDSIAPDGLVHRAGGVPIALIGADEAAVIAREAARLVGHRRGQRA